MRRIGIVAVAVLGLPLAAFAQRPGGAGGGVGVHAGAVSAPVAAVRVSAPVAAGARPVNHVAAAAREPRRGASSYIFSEPDCGGESKVWKFQLCFERCAGARVRLSASGGGGAEERAVGAKWKISANGAVWVWRVFDHVARDCGGESAGGGRGAGDRGGTGRWRFAGAV